MSVGTTSVSAQSNEGSVYIDTVVVGGPAAPGDFTDEVGGVGGIVDSTAAQCNITTVFGDSANCSPPATLPPGTHSVTATSVAPSYVQTGLACPTNNDGTISGGGSSAEVGTLTVTLCTFAYSYVTPQIGVDVVVMNDDPPATPSWSTPPSSNGRATSPSRRLRSPRDRRRTRS